MIFVKPAEVSVNQQKEIQLPKSSRPNCQQFFILFDRQNYKTETQCDYGNKYRSRQRVAIEKYNGHQNLTSTPSIKTHNCIIATVVIREHVYWVQVQSLHQYSSIIELP